MSTSFCHNFFNIRWKLNIQADAPIAIDSAMRDDSKDLVNVNVDPILTHELQSILRNGI